MRAHVVYESFFGNTEQIAEAIAKGLGPSFEVEVNEVGEAEFSLDADLVVIGGPTHMWGLSHWFTRGGARRQARAAGGEPPSQGRSLRDWIRHAVLPSGARVAVFDTAVRRSGWMPTGSAAKKLAKQVERRGFSLCEPPTQFYVTSDNTLEDGEREQAEAWGRELATLVARSV